MDRRNFLLALAGLAGALTTASVLMDEAHAMPLADGLPDAGAPETAPTAAIATPADMDGAKVEDAYYYYRRRYRRRYFLYRPRYYRRRRFFRRRFFY